MLKLSSDAREADISYFLGDWEGHAGRRLTVGGDGAVGVGEEDEAEDGQDDARHHELADEDEEDQPRVLVEAHSCDAQQPGTQLDLIPPAQLLQCSACRDDHEPEA